MRTIRLLALGLFFAAVFSSTTYSQAGAQPAGAPKTPVAGAQTATLTKIGIVNSLAFADEKLGITKFINATKALNAEFAPVQTELSGMNTKLEGLAKEIETLRSQAAGGKVPIDEKVYQTKMDEAERLQRDIKFKQEDAKARLQRRQVAVLDPVMQDIGKGLTEYSKQKGFLIIFDIAKDEAGLIIAIGDEKIDVTKDFITFYNARP